MKALYINGGRELNGSLNIVTAKNALLPILLIPLSRTTVVRLVQFMNALSGTSTSLAGIVMDSMEEPANEPGAIVEIVSSRTMFFSVAVAG